LLRSGLKDLVAGGLGFIGSNLVSKLGKRGCEVWTCDLKHAEIENYVRCDVGRFPALSRWEMFGHALFSEFGCCKFTLLSGG